MKSTILVMGLILLLGGKIVFAVNNSDTPGASKSTPEIIMKTYAPGTPKEATFNDETNLSNIDFLSIFLQPRTPKTASFEDESLPDQDLGSIMKQIAPQPPKSANFTEEEKSGK